MVEARAVQSEMAAALSRGATVLVPHQRAANGLRRDHLRQEGLTAEQPRLLPWRAWTSRLWHRALLTGADDRLLLNRTQEQALWREVIEQEPAVSSLRDPGSLARLAMDACAGLAQHRGLGRLAGSATNADTETFLRLATVFDQRCRREGYLPEARLESALRRTMLAHKLAGEERELLVCGFDRLLPAQRALLDAAEQCGVRVELLPHAEPAGDVRSLEARDENEELRAAAVGCGARLERRPGGRIALLVPGLREKGRAARIDRVLREVLAPGAGAIGAQEALLPYEIACDATLAESSLGAGALDLLAWSTGPLSLERVGALLLSPLLPGGEQGARAEFDGFELRRSRMLRPEVELDWVLKRLARSPRRERLAGLADGLRAMQTAARRRFGPSERRAWGEWAEAVRELLSATGWAGSAAADAAGHATRRAWESALDELATLDFEGRRVAWVEALTALRAIAAETMVATPFRDAPVQVMAPADAAGMSFDAVWFLRAGDLTWPLAEGANPLVGWPLQRELGMPGADPATDRAHARRVTESIAGSAATVVFSYARETPEGQQRRSPVLDGLCAQTTAAEPGTTEDEPLVRLEAVAERSPIPHPPVGPVSGGVSVLGTQAACGFRAFAEWRLFSSELEIREPGMNLRERGTAVHDVLEHFWEGVGTQAALRLMPAEERGARLAESADHALAEALAGAKTTWDRAYLETQRRRLIALGQRWLKIEAERAVPFTVARRESETPDAAIGPLRLRLRVDRIDRTEYGAVLIDYKTGEAGPSDWLGDRPDQPQLPLYAVLAREPLHAIAFGAVRPGKKMQFTGYQDGAGTLTKPVAPDASSLEEQIDAWERVLTRLANDFWQGDTRVLPKSYPSTCKYCAQRLLCRLDPASLTSIEEEEEAGEEVAFGEGEIPG